jgi:hypothetical protein
VGEGFVFTMDIRNEMLSALGQIEDSLQIYDLRAGGLNRGVLLGEQAQIPELFRLECVFYCHTVSS